MAVSRGFHWSPLLALALVLVSACGKSGGLANVPPAPGLYRLDDGATALELRPGGTFTVRREVRASIGDLECGSWKQDTISPTGHVVLREGLYWPTPPRYPATVFRRLALHGEENGDLVVVGESDWAGSFTQRWRRGGSGTLPACTPPRL